ncbi:hypothetical protein E4U57_005783 [Claviceps arundinis]|uniref:FAD-binding domain-containing protein n=1 Tax=Claviceps arundinis TaxID=1623583 RepID=A0A9P7N090_9HYPO|nr:hypothetical protein E4U57_005783 [Claviceps arundinis]KAG5978039.1 hypothetical protein E4U56_005517 [Claviceps arundinis]
MASSAALDIIIIGAGVSGLTTALALCRLGIRADVYERNPTITELGAGIAIGPNAAHMLGKLGLEAKLDEVSSRPQEGVNLKFREHADSTVKFVGRLNTERRSFYCHRAKLVRILADELPQDQIHLDKCLRDVTQNDHSVTAHFHDDTSVTGHVLIGADGIKSFARSLWNQESCVFSGQIVVRNLIKAEALPPELHDCLVHGQVWLAPGRQHVVTFPIERAKYLAVGAIAPAIPGHEWGESWKIRGDVNFQDQLQSFDPPVRELFKYSEGQTIYGLYERNELPTWIHGRLVLVGDSAHAMLPHQGQGGSQSIEDAIVLSLTLAAAAASPPTDLSRWLQTYQAARKPRTDHAAQISRATGQAFDKLMFSEEGMRFLQNAYSLFNKNDLFEDLRKAVEAEFGVGERLELVELLTRRL